MDLSGIWGFNGLPFLDLTFDGSGKVSGATYWHATGRSARAEISTGWFDAKSNALRLEGEAPSLGGTGESHYIIEGRLEMESLTGTYDCGGVKGEFIFTKIARQ